ncbi:hypothetical protein CI109_107007 [Kwoniella shandongensis]|uniref:Uncharacterized protein n=1 Tax=Kwoniella shandongensis TaxID=1734106 RepID=A0AAJ8LSP6_9TREE
MSSSDFTTPLKRTTNYTTSPEADSDIDPDIKPFIQPQPITPSGAKKRRSTPSSTPSKVKVEQSDFPTYFDGSADIKPKLAKVKTNTTPTKSTTPFTPGGSAKARFAELILDAGLKGFDRNQVEAETGLTKAQQTEMLKKGRGSLWKALYAHASTL